MMMNQPQEANILKKVIMSLIDIFMLHFNTFSNNSYHSTTLISVTYKVSVKTGSKLGAGTDANVYIILIGKNKKTERLYLKDVKKGDKVFERNSQDDFQLEADDVGKVPKKAS